MAIPLGDLNFDTINIDHRGIARALQDFVNRGSQRGRIEITDLTIIKRREDGPDQFDTVAQALESGTRIFDALLYFCIPEEQRPPVVHDELGEGLRDPNMNEVASAIFYIWFFLLTRANLPPRNETPDNNNPLIPKFLSVYMGLNENTSIYYDRIASFRLENMEHRWIKFITFTNLSQATIARMGLGVAGYRMINPITMYEPKDNASQRAKEVREILITWLNNGPVWDCHPITRTGVFLNVVKNFNQNIGNLLLELYTDEQLQDMSQLRMIYRVPLQNPRFNQWKTWDLGTFTGFNDTIFPDQG